MIKEKLKRGTIPYKIYLYFNIFVRYYFFHRNRKTFSQFGEDLFITDFFENQEKGKYVDLGAFHPMRLSNTYLLYKKGWTGTNVDLNPISIDLFNIARNDDNNICALISDQNNVLKNAYFENAWSAANSIVASDDLPFKKEMKTETFNNLVNHDFDFLNIDLEGADYEALQSLDFQKYRPGIICIEINEQKVLNSKIFKYLFERNYEMIWSSKSNFSHIFIKKT